MTTNRFSVLFICMGNICRSPTAHGVFRAKVRAAGLARQVGVDSAATHDYHPGEAPDARSQRHALRRGYDLSDLRARHLTGEDFERADLLLTMDETNLAHAARCCPSALRHKLQPFAGYCRVHVAGAVPDPYYGSASDFELVLDLVEDASEGLLEHVRRQIGHG